MSKKRKPAPELDLTSGTGPRDTKLPHFYFRGRDLVSCEGIGTRAKLDDGTPVEAQQWGGVDTPEAVFYVPVRGCGVRRARGWSAKVDAKLAELAWAEVRK